MRVTLRETNAREGAGRKGIEKHDQIPYQSHGEYIISILPTWGESVKLASLY